MCISALCIFNIKYLLLEILEKNIWEAKKILFEMLKNALNIDAENTCY